MCRYRASLYLLLAGLLVLVATAACGAGPTGHGVVPTSTPATEVIVWGRVATQCT
jgi:hypothetical protein